MIKARTQSERPVVVVDVVHVFDLLQPSDHGALANAGLFVQSPPSPGPRG
jgi:hypothetical protein